jgi:hypothetical protein
LRIALADIGHAKADMVTFGTRWVIGGVGETNVRSALEWPDPPQEG